MKIKEEFLILLETLCAFDSRKNNVSGVDQLNNVLQKELRSLGFSCEKFASSAEEREVGKHLVADLKGRKNGRVLFLGHMDTVMSPEQVPFRYDQQMDKVFGAGVADMKGGIAIMLMVLRKLVAENVELPSVTVILNASEEEPIASFAPFLRSIARDADFCVNFEPALIQADGGGLAIAKCRKGVSRFKLSCKGNAAHAGVCHQAGANAIREIARKIELIESLTDYDKDLTANVGVVKGGKAYNQVADYAEIEFELRSFNPDVLEKAALFVRRECGVPMTRSGDGKTVCEIELREEAGYPAFPTDLASLELIDQYIRLADKMGAPKISALPRGGGSDSNHLFGVLPIVDGVGLPGGGLHTENEYADTSLIERLIDLNAAFIGQIRRRVSMPKAGK